MKEMTIVTDLYVSTDLDAFNGECFALISITEKEFKVLDQYINTMNELVDKKLYPSVLNTDNVPSVRYVSLGYDIDPLEKDLLNNPVFPDSNDKQTFDEIFNADSDDFTDTWDVEVEAGIDGTRLNFRADGTIWISGVVACYYSITTIETVGFSTKFFNDVVRPYFEK